jgi:WD40 repeat protein
VQDDEEHVYAGDGRGQLHVWRAARYLGAIPTGGGGEEDEEEVRHVLVSRSDSGGGVVVTVSRQGGTVRCWQQDVLCERATKHHAMPPPDGMMVAVGEKLSEVRNVTCLLFHPNKQHLVTDHKDAIKIWSVESGKCLRSNPKPRGLEHSADEMLWDLSSELLFLLNCSSELRLCICDMSTGQYVPLPQLDGLDVLAMTLSSPHNTLHIITKQHGQCTLWIFNSASRSIEKSIVVPSKNTFQTNCMKVRLTDTGKYLVFMIKCTEIEVNIIKDAEKKGNLSISPSYHTCPSYKFAALNLKQPTKELLLCYRQLTKIITLGSVMEILDGNIVLIGRQRASLQWDIDTGNTDSKLVKGTKTPQYFRPIWIEHDQDWGSICHGPIHAIHRNAPGPAKHRAGGQGEEKNVASVLAQGSQDGWCMIYDETGQSVNINMGKRSNHDGSPVSGLYYFRGGSIKMVHFTALLKCRNITKP